MSTQLNNETNTEQKQLSTVTIIVDEDLAAYVQQEQLDMEDYILSLLQREKEVQQARGKTPGEKRTNDITTSAPDTSGYPEMTGNFTTEPK